MPEAIHRADGGVTPVELLALLQAIATSWSSMNPEYGARAPSKASRRAAVVEAVRRLLTS
jgi:hypothetical protein